jgi:hypothetical protein
MSEPAEAPFAIEVVANGSVIMRLDVPTSLLHRLARRQQANATPMGLQQGATATLAVQGARQPHDSSLLHWRLSAQEGSQRNDLPLSILEPLLAPFVAKLYRAGKLAPGDSLSYAVVGVGEQPAHAWTETLPPFGGVTPTALPAVTDLLPGRAGLNDIPFVVPEPVLTAAADYCRAPIEKGGMLLGCLHHDGHDGQANGLWVEAVAFAPATNGERADDTHITFTAEAWQSIHRQRAELEKRLGAASLHIVGWVHGHVLEPDKGLFFSQVDVVSMGQYFDEPYCMGLVCCATAGPGAPLNERIAAFGWDEWGVTIVPRSIWMTQEATQ